jgi:hypothetical protein
MIRIRTEIFSWIRIRIFSMLIRNTDVSVLVGFPEGTLYGISSFPFIRDPGVKS